MSEQRCDPYIEGHTRLAIKKNGILPFQHGPRGYYVMWSWSEKDKYISLMCGI